MITMLLPGDEFLVESKTIYGVAIDAHQWVKSRDGRSVYTHGGLLLGRSGQTFEALGRVRTANLFERYAGKRVKIVRPKIQTYSRSAVQAAMISWALKDLRREHEGQRYPFWRILFMLTRPTARLIGNGKFGVCSELVAKFEQKIGLRDYWKGVMPDDLHDEWRISRHHEEIFEGILPADVAGLERLLAGQRA